MLVKALTLATLALASQDKPLGIQWNTCKGEQAKNVA